MDNEPESYRPPDLNPNPDLPDSLIQELAEFGLKPGDWRALEWATMLRLGYSDGQLRPRERMLLQEKGRAFTKRVAIRFNQAMTDDEKQIQAIELYGRILDHLAPSDAMFQRRGTYQVLREMVGAPPSLDTVITNPNKTELDEAETFSWILQVLKLGEFVPPKREPLPPSDPLVPPELPGAELAVRCLPTLEGMAGTLAKSEQLLFEESHSGKGLLDGRAKLVNLDWGSLSTWKVDGGVVLVPSQCVTGMAWFFVGDLHGDYQALSKVLEITGFPRNPSVHLCFLGDFGDRGPGTLPILIELLALKAAAPERVILLRGNHEHLRALDAEGDVLPVEAANIASWGQASLGHSGYLDSVQAFFAPQASNLNDAYRRVHRLFESLPTMALFEDGLMACHGGVVSRFPSELPLKGRLDPAIEAELRVESLGDLRRPKIQDYMRWSRCEGRQETLFVWQGEKWNTCFDFGDLDSFFERTGLKRLVRGHDHPAEARMEHDGKILTICTSRAMNNGEYKVVPQIAQYAHQRLPRPIELY